MPFFTPFFNAWGCERGSELRAYERSPKHILEGHAGQVWCVAVSPDDATIANASADFTVKLWNIQLGKLLQTLTGHLGEVRTVKFSAN